MNIGTPEQSRTEKKLASFANLRAGWHYGSGDAISADVLTRAQRMYRVLLALALTRTDAFASADGSVLLSVLRGDHHVELFVYPNGTYSVAYNKGDDLEALSEDEAKHALREVSGAIWNTSGSSTRTTLGQTSSASNHWPTRTLVTAGCP